MSPSPVLWLKYVVYFSIVFKNAEKLLFCNPCLPLVYKQEENTQENVSLYVIMTF
jgi:hypothetical protein